MDTAVGKGVGIAAKKFSLPTAPPGEKENEIKREGGGRAQNRQNSCQILSDL